MIAIGALGQDTQSCLFLSRTELDKGDAIRLWIVRRKLAREITQTGLW